jgi:hypothetical protein
MTDSVNLSINISTARKRIKKAHQMADTWTEGMGQTAEAIDALGIQHYGRAGEDTPARILESQVRAMADLTFAYAEQAYEAEGDELTFHDDGQREKFNEQIDKAHETAMTALRQIEDDD